MKIGLFVILLVSLWAASIFWLYGWAKFWTFFVLNLLLMIVYTALVVVFSHKLPGVDPYGLRKILLLAVMMTGHALAGFIFAFWKQKHFRKPRRAEQKLF